MARSQFEEGWTAHHKKLVEMIDARYQPGDLLWIELHDMAEKLMKPQKPVVKESLTVAEPAAVNYVGIFCEMYTRQFGTAYVFMDAVDGRALKPLRQAFPPGSEAAYRQVVRAFFRDVHDPEMNGDTRGFRAGVGFKMRLLPERIQKYIDAIAAQAEDEPDDAPRFSKGDERTLREMMG